MFPLSINGSVRLNFEGAVSDRRVKAVSQRIAKMLRDAAATNVLFEDNQVDFTTELFRRTGPFNVLFPFDAGTLRVEAAAGSVRLRYALSTRRLAIIAAVLVLVMGAIMLGTAEEPNPLPPVIILAAGWFSLFTLAYLLAMIRFRRWARKCLRNAPELRTAHSNVTTGEPLPL